VKRERLRSGAGATNLGGNGATGVPSSSSSANIRFKDDMAGVSAFAQSMAGPSMELTTGGAVQNYEITVEQ